METATARAPRPRATPAAARSAGLRRGLEILGLFSVARPALGVSEVARELGVHKSRVHRALTTLEDMGYVRREPATRRYALGFKALEIGALAGRLANTMGWARPQLRALAARFSASVSIRLVDESDLLVIDTIESLDDPELHLPVGARVPLNYGAGGAVRAAFMSDREVLALARTHGLPRYTAKSLVTPQAFLAAVLRARKAGRAVSDGETVRGSFSVAAPIVNGAGALVAVLVGSRRREGYRAAQIQAFARAVAEAAGEISREGAQSGRIAGPSRAKAPPASTPAGTKKPGKATGVPAAKGPDRRRPGARPANASSPDAKAPSTRGSRGHARAG
jgi:IclR family acetate operon transcriptional repressor